MVSIIDVRELFLVLALIGGFSGAFIYYNTLESVSFDNLRLVSPTSTNDPRVLGASTHIPLVANPVVHINVPEHNIFEPQ